MCITDVHVRRPIFYGFDVNDRSAEQPGCRALDSGATVVFEDG